MRVIALLLLIVAGSNRLRAQTDSVEKIFAFKITAYIKSLSDSSTVVQVLKPPSLPVHIREKQLATLFHCYKTDEKLDTAMIGWGRCQLIKGEYYYFSIKHIPTQKPADGDLIYILLKLPYVYNGFLLNVLNHAIQFTNVYDEPFMNNDAIFTNTEKNEQDLLDSMVNDIRFTGTVMQEQMPQLNQPVKGGIYNGKNCLTPCRE